MSRPVVLSVYYQHKPGGFTKRLYRAYQAIANSGHELVYIACSELPVTGENIRPVILPMRSQQGTLLYWPEFYLKAVFTLRRLTKAHQVNTHFVFAFFYASASILAALGLPVKTITLIRGDDVFDAKYKSCAWVRSTIHRLLEKIGVRFSARVLATSHSMRDAIQARNRPAQNIAVLPNDITGTALGIAERADHESVKMVTVSVLNERKNIALALHALAQIKHLDWEYLLIGPDTSGKHYAQTLQKLSTELGIADRVHFLGWQSNVADLLQNCHLFVFPTLMEGSPNALMEAMGYGLPCLVSRIPEVTEVLSDPELHFDPQDPDELAQKMAAFINDRNFARQIKHKTADAQKHYRFDWDQCIADLIVPAAPAPKSPPLPSQTP